MLARRLLADPGLPRPQPTPSYWQQPEHDIANTQSTSLSPGSDVVIIGSGITACAATYSLLEADHSSSKPTITILEARSLCSGATGRNGGHIKYNAVPEYARLKKILGSHEAAAPIVRFCRSQYQAIREAAEHLGVKEVGEIREVVAVTAYMSKALFDDMRVALDDFNANFPEWSKDYVLYGPEDASKLFALQNTQGCLVGPAGAAWPYRVVTGIFQSLLKKYRNRLSIETSTPALEIIKSGSELAPFTVRTPRGKITTRNVIHCSEGHTAHLLPRLRGILWPRRGQMTVQKPDSKGMIASHAGRYSWAFIFPSKFDYVTQNSKTGEIFIGGGETDVADSPWDIYAQPSDTEELMGCKIHLVGVLPQIMEPRPEHMPQLKASWTGIMGFSVDAMPMVGRLPEAVTGRRTDAEQDETGLGVGEWIAAGYGGYGMVNSWLCGRAIGDMVLHPGRDDLPFGLPSGYIMDEARYGRLYQALDERLAAGTKMEHSYRALL